MNVVLLTSSYHLSANVGIRAFLEDRVHQKKKFKVTGVVCTATFDFNDRGYKVMNKFMATSGFWFFAKNVITTTLKHALVWVSSFLWKPEKRAYLGIREMAAMHRIPYIEVDKINDPKTLEWIKARKPDLLVSCFLLQIMKPELLKIPPQGTINCHPALTQKHRGVFTAFWALLKNWKRSGATVHYVTGSGLDDGPIILQRRFFVHPSDSVYSVNEKSAALGGHLLAKAVIKIQNDETSGTTLKSLGHVFKMPTLEEVRKFYRRGKTTMRWKELFKF